MKGGTATIWLNGKHVLTFEHPGKTKAKGPIGLQLHGNKVMKTDFRNIRAKDL